MSVFEEFRYAMVPFTLMHEDRKLYRKMKEADDVVTNLIGILEQRAENKENYRTIKDDIEKYRQSGKGSLLGGVVTEVTTFLPVIVAGLDYLSNAGTENLSLILDIFLMMSTPFIRFNHYKLTNSQSNQFDELRIKGIELIQEWQKLR